MKYHSVNKFENSKTKLTLSPKAADDYGRPLFLARIAEFYSYRAATYNRICCSLLQRSKSPAICHNSTLLLFQMCEVRNEARTFQHVHLHNEPLIQQNHEIRFDEFFSLFYHVVL
jgi:hypothetical protein